MHLAAAVPNFAWLETRAPEVKLGFDNSDFFPVQPRLAGVDQESLRDLRTPRPSVDVLQRTYQDADGVS